jgi:hypothetical protein
MGLAAARFSAERSETLKDPLGLFIAFCVAIGFLALTWLGFELWKLSRKRIPFWICACLVTGTLRPWMFSEPLRRACEEKAFSDALLRYGKLYRVIGIGFVLVGLATVEVLS